MACASSRMQTRTGVCGVAILASAGETSVFSVPMLRMGVAREVETGVRSEALRPPVPFFCKWNIPSVAKLFLDSLDQNPRDVAQSTA